MSKRDLKKYVKELKRSDLEEQIIELYDKFKEVKTYYDFIFNPKENKLLDDAIFKIRKEYFPVSSRKAKMRRSTAQKLIKHYKQLGVDAQVICEIMVSNIEIAQKYRANKFISAESFYKSILKSYEESLVYIERNGLTKTYLERLKEIAKSAEKQDWINKWDFEDAAQTIYSI